MPDAAPRTEPPDAAGTAHGPGRVLVAVYGVFALAAGARAAVQLSVQFDEAPLAYLLSALAAVVYLVATVAITFELIGVLVVGTLSLADRQAFPDATVWSGYGEGYLFIPLVLPVLGLLWLRRRRAAQNSPPPKSPPKSPPPTSPPASP